MGGILTRSEHREAGISGRSRGGWLPLVSECTLPLQNKNVTANIKQSIQRQSVSKIAKDFFSGLEIMLLSPHVRSGQLT